MIEFGSGMITLASLWGMDYKGQDWRLGKVLGSW